MKGTLEQFDILLMNEDYAEAYAYAIDNGLEKEALRLCIEYVQEDDEKTSPIVVSWYTIDEMANLKTTN